MQTYVRPKLVFTHGEGARMYDAAGKEYLDFAAGIAVNALGAPNEPAEASDLLCGAHPAFNSRRQSAGLGNWWEPWQRVLYWALSWHGLAPSATLSLRPVNAAADDHSLM